MIGGEGAYAAALEEPGRPLGNDVHQRFVGVRYHSGGRGGSLRPIVVTDAGAMGCFEVSLTVRPDAPLQRFVAYSEPATFIPLERFPTARAEVARKAEPLIRAKGGTDELVPSEIWRFAPAQDEPPLVVATIHSANYLDPATAGDEGGFDAVALFREQEGTLTLLDGIVLLADPAIAVRVDATPVAAAINPFTGRADLFVDWMSFEYEKLAAYDISAGKLDERAGAECAM